MTYEEALSEARKKGVGRCSDAAAMAAFCEANIHILVGAVSPKLMWDGAQRKGMTFLEFGRLVGADPIAASELMWVE